MLGMPIVIAIILICYLASRRDKYGAEHSREQRAKGGIVLPETERKRAQRAQNRADLAAWKAERQAAAQAPKAPAKPKAAKVPKAVPPPPAEVTPLPAEDPPEATAPEPTPEPPAKPESQTLVHREPAPVRPAPAKVSVAPAKVKRARSASTATTFDPAPVKARKGCPTHPFGSGYCKACQAANAA